MDLSVVDQSNDDNMPFSPVKVVESRTPRQQGNLTGISRKVKDNCADLHNQILKWDNLKTKGANIISEVANKQIASQISDNSEVILNGDEPFAVIEVDKDLQRLTDELENVVHSLEKIISKMKTISRSLNGICELDRHQSSDKLCSVPLFQTWPLEKFGKVGSDIVKMYEKELPVKVTVKENVAHTSDRNLLMTYSATWIHELFINSDVKFMLDSMLVDTGLK